MRHVCACLDVISNHNSILTSLPFLTIPTIPTIPQTHSPVLLSRGPTPPAASEGLSGWTVVRLLNTMPSPNLRSPSTPSSHATWALSQPFSPPSLPRPPARSRPTHPTSWPLSNVSAPTSSTTSDPTTEPLPWLQARLSLSNLTMASSRSATKRLDLGCRV